uniref:Uncharacterized protein n=1 Tax=Pseudomonas fluorescens (strain SBW25) TaxID=216595 RepID=A0A0G4E4Z3_PSEFS|nr:hypothetical protein PQBR57_0347 [Pseudomonas fluorescens SBW25]
MVCLTPIKTVRIGNFLDHICCDVEPQSIGEEVQVSQLVSFRLLPQGR